MLRKYKTLFYCWYIFHKNDINGKLLTICKHPIKTIAYDIEMCLYILSLTLKDMYI